MNEEALRVFISSDARGMEAERRAARAAVQAIPLSRPILIEFSSGSSDFPSESYLTTVQDSDVFILLLKGKVTRRAKAEVDAAQDAGRTVLLFVAEESPDKVRSFAELLGVKYKRFNDASQLATVVAESFGDALISEYRRYFVPTNELSVIASFLEQLAAGNVQIVAEADIAVSGTVASGGGANIRGDLVGGDIVGRDIFVVGATGSKVVFGDVNVVQVGKPRGSMVIGSALNNYLQHVIRESRYVPLQGIRSAGRVAEVELVDVYVRPTFVRGQSEAISLAELLADHRHLVILGEPGLGKTALLRYLALLYARDLVEKSHLVENELEIREGGRVPFYVHLSEFHSFLQSRYSEFDYSSNLHALLHFIDQSMASLGFDVPRRSLQELMQRGEAVLLLDGLDTIPRTSGHSEISRLFYEIADTYPDSRCVITSRVASYSVEMPVAIPFDTVKLRAFDQENIERFLTNWNLLIAVSQMGAGARSRSYAAKQTVELLSILDANERIGAMASNPMLLTMMAIVFSLGRSLPKKVSDLYRWMVDLLLDSSSHARGESRPNTIFDRLIGPTEQRMLLSELALHMQDLRLRSIEQRELLSWLENWLSQIPVGTIHLDDAARSALRSLEERSGLLVDNRDNSYGFSQFVIQEYLASTAIASKPDVLQYTLSRVSDLWWREVILLEVEELSGSDTRQAASIIEGIADSDYEVECYGNLVFAAECMSRVDYNQALAHTVQGLRKRLRAELDAPSPSAIRQRKKVGKLEWVECRRRLAQAYVEIGGGYWSIPYGEPEWIDISAGAFRPGGDLDGQQVFLEGYAIARTPITNAQYLTFIRDTGYAAPPYWIHSRPPMGTESHPVVCVSWQDAVAYCEWLGRMTGKPISLPAEAEWERAARGASIRLAYPWGEKFISENCNTYELGVKQTTPVGIFSKGASPDGCLDMSGNVWEWTASLAATEALAISESVEDDNHRAVRGGSWREDRTAARCTTRSNYASNYRSQDLGFRVVLSLPQRTLLDEATDFFGKAGFVVTAADRGLGEFCVSTEKWATHTNYGSILVQIFRGDLSGDHLRHLEHRLKRLAVAPNLAYAVYEGKLSDDAFWQMGAYKIGNGLTIIPLKAELLHEALLAVQPNCYARLRVVEQEYLGQGANRYEGSNAITDPTWFFGRSAEVEEILDRLNTGQHAGIFGMRKIGKTSLLLHLKQSVSRLSIPVAYLGLQSKTIDPEMLFKDVVQQFRSVLESMGLSILPESGLLSNEPPASIDKLFREDIQALWQAAKTELKVPFMLLMIDEADRIVPKPGSAESIYQRYDQFFAPIRDLSQVERCLLTIVTAERPTIREEFNLSPLPNTMFELYDERYLSSFSVPELENMIVRIGKWMGLEYSTESLSMIVEYSACHPYVARSLCACIARNLQGGSVTAKEVLEAREDALSRLHSYFLGWWSNLLDEERQILHAVLTTKALPAEMTELQQDALRYLLKQQSILQTTNGWTITIGLLREWLERRIGGNKWM